MVIHFKYMGNAGSIFGSGRSPEEEIATYSRTLAWEIPWTEEQTTVHGVVRVRHDLAIKPPPPFIFD